MANGPTIKNYSAADIEKYQQGLLSPAEMHALEKAALEDPFLADAMEGYAHAGAALQTDLDDLKKRLAQRMEEKTKVIPMGGAGRSSFPWMRAAAMIGVLAGAGTLAYLFMFRNNVKEIAQVKQDKISPATNVADSAKNSTTPIIAGTDTLVASGNTTYYKNTEIKPGTLNSISDSSTLVSKDKVSGLFESDRQTADAELVVVNDKPEDLAKSAKRISAELEKKQTDAAKKEESNDLAFTTTVPASGKGAPTAATQAKAKAIAPAPARNLEETNFYKTNIFRGRVTDGMNFGVPFAKVINTDDNVGTYTDARGYFNLTSPDSVLNVQVRSIGYENNVIQLKNNLPSNQVVLQNDSRSLNAFVINNQRPNASRRADNNNIKLEEPVPADGWENYDTYLSNNLVMPEEYRTKPNTTGTTAVEVSFEVDAKGEPVNIRVEKSLCDNCDKEAIRLIQEGPKWKRNARNGRTTVTIPFNQLF